MKLKLSCPSLLSSSLRLVIENCLNSQLNLILTTDNCLDCRVGAGVGGEQQLHQRGDVDGDDGGGVPDCAGLQPVHCGSPGGETLLLRLQEGLSLRPTVLPAPAGAGGDWEDLQGEGRLVASADRLQPRPVTDTLRLQSGRGRDEPRLHLPRPRPPPLLYSRSHGDHNDRQGQEDLLSPELSQEETDLHLSEAVGEGRNRGRPHGHPDSPLGLLQSCHSGSW